MTIFDAEDWQQLESEIMALYIRSLPQQEFQSELSSLLHEWHESAVAIGSPELVETLKEDREMIAETERLSKGALEVFWKKEESLEIPEAFVGLSQEDADLFRQNMEGMMKPGFPNF